MVSSPALGAAAPWLGARAGARSLFISAESTPNPDSLKFCPSDVVILQDDQGTGVVSRALQGGPVVLGRPPRRQSPAVERSRSDAAATNCGLGAWSARPGPVPHSHLPSARTACRLSQFFNSLPKARGSSMVSELLRLPHVTGVFLGRDFVTVNKHEDAQWEDIKPLIMSAIMSGLTSSEPVLQGSYHVDDAAAFGDDDDEVVAMIRELIEMRVRPAVQEDGGDIFFVAFDHETGIVRLKMAGSCVGCPSSTATLRGGVENMLRHYVPEVEGIEQVVEDGEGGHKPMDDEDAPAESLEERLAAAGVPGYAR